jgi:hypothetical protein
MTGQCERIVDEILSNGDPRSAEYRQGCMAVFLFRDGGICIPHPFAMGTVEADAYYAGIERGHHEWANRLEPRR